MTHLAPVPAPILIIPDAAASWPVPWQAADPGVTLVAADDALRSLPAVRDYEMAHLILAHPGAVVVAGGDAAAAVLRLLATWPHLPLGGLLLIDPPDGARPRWTDPALGVPVILYRSGTVPETTRTGAQRLARGWGALLAEPAEEVGRTAADWEAQHLPSLRSLADQLARARRPAAAADAATPPPVTDDPAEATSDPVALPPRRAWLSPMYMPRPPM